MPLDGSRLARLRKVKLNMKQADLARMVGVTQTHISELEAGKEPSVPLLESLADFLDCTTEFLLRRSFKNVDEDDDAFRAAVSEMACDAFTERMKVDGEQKLRCRRVLGHRAAPVTADGWAILSEQIARAIGTPPTGDLRLAKGGA